MEITKQTISIKLTKSEMTNLVNEALLDETAGPAIKRIINPMLVNAFPQFPNFSNVTLSTTDESGATLVLLREPREKTVKSVEEVETDAE